MLTALPILGVFPKPQLTRVNTRTQGTVGAPEPPVCKKGTFQQSQKQVKQTLPKNHTGIAELTLELQESIGRGLWCLFQDYFLHFFFKSVLPRVKNPWF